jgi:hypothetical protein
MARVLLAMVMAAVGARVLTIIIIKGAMRLVDALEEEAAIAALVMSQFLGVNDASRRHGENLHAAPGICCYTYCSFYV